MLHSIHHLPSLGHRCLRSDEQYSEEPGYRCNCVSNTVLICMSICTSPKCSTIFGFSSGSFPQAGISPDYLFSQRALIRWQRSWIRRSWFRQKQVCKQKVLELFTSLFFIPSAYSEEPGCFPRLSVCSLHLFFPSQGPSWCKYLSWPTHDWS